MTITESLAAKAPPVKIDEDGALRVGGTRITLDLLIEEYQLGATAEEIAMAYDSLSLADVHGALDYFLRNRAVVEEYLNRRRSEASMVRVEVERRTPQEGIRERLLARQTRQDKG